MDTFYLTKKLLKQGYKAKLNRENLYSYVIEVSDGKESSIVTLDKFISIGYEHETISEALQIAYDEIKQKEGR